VARLFLLIFSPCSTSSVVFGFRLIWVLEHDLPPSIELPHDCLLLRISQPASKLVRMLVTLFRSARK
jgi:hypothetical protein